MDSISTRALEGGNSPFSSVLTADAWPTHLQRHAPGLAWLRKRGGGIRRHLSLPSDLFLLTVYCDEQLRCGPGGDDGELEIVVSALRTQPARFRSSGSGQLAVALLTPLGLLQTLRAPMEELTDCRIPLERFVGRAAQRDLHQGLLASRTPDERLHRLAAWLERRICDHGQLTDAPRRVAMAATHFYESDGEPVSIEQVASTLAVGRRQLERDFRRWLGVSPNTYGRLVRFQRAVGAVSAGEELTQVAAMHGYADQSHMTRAFREMALCTPGDIARWRRRPAMAGLQRAMAGRLLVTDDDSPLAENRPAPAQRSILETAY